MSVVDARTEFTLLDRVQRGGGNKNMLNTVNTLTQVNKMFEDAKWQESTDGTFHKYKLVQNLPEGTWRLLNQGVKPTKASMGQATENLGMLRAISRIDEDEFDGRSDKDAYRTDQDKLAVEGLGQQLMDTMIYGDPSGGKTFTGAAGFSSGGPGTILGLTPRFNSLSLPNVINNGGVVGNALTSIWIVQWEQDRMGLVYPKGAPHAGLDIEEAGLEKYGDETNGYYWAWTSKFKSTLGIAVPDVRCCIRIANIETGAGATKPFNEDMVIDALNMMPNPEKAVIYVNRKMLGAIQKKVKTQTNHFFGDASTDKAGGNAFGGQYAPAYLFGRPVKLVERIRTDETAVS